jgi:hypothetical protein
MKWAVRHREALYGCSAAVLDLPRTVIPLNCLEHLRPRAYRYEQNHDSQS